MAHTINKIHSDNTLISNTDESLYKYTNGRWEKQNTSSSSTPINYYKYYDVEPTTDLNPDDFNTGDYIISYLSKSNKLRYSESLSKSNWIRSKDNKGISTLNDSINTSSYFFPNTANMATKLITYNITDTSTAHSIEQSFNSLSNKIYVCSCYIKKEDLVTTSDNVSLTLFINNYNFGISAKYDLSSETGYDESGYKTVEVNYIDKDYKTPSDTSILNNISNITAGLQRITVIGGEPYYRLYIISRFNFQANISFRLNILNTSKEYLYSSNGSKSKFSFLVNGFQMEDYDVANITKPDLYITTYANKITLKLYYATYKVFLIGSSKVIQKTQNSVNYATNVVEKTENGITYLTKVEPAIANVFDGDIIIIPSMLSFTNYDSSNKNNDDTAIEFGCKYISNNPDNTICFNESLGEYIIKDGNTYKILRSKTDKKKIKAMVRSIIFGRRYFETWSKQGSCRYKLGYNTGGGCNFWKSTKINSKLP